MPDLTYDIGLNDRGVGAGFAKIADSIEQTSEATKRLEAVQVKARSANVAAQKAALDLSDAQQRLAKVTADATATDDQKRRASLAVEAAEVKQSKATLALRKANEEVADSGNEAKQSFLETAEASGALTGAVAGVASKLTEFGAEFAGELAKGAGEALLEGASLRSKLQAQLGLAAGDAARYGKLAGTLYSQNYGGSLDEVVDAIAKVKQSQAQLRVASDSDLQDITGTVLNVAQAFGVDLEGVIDDVGKMLTNGMAPNAKAALDVIVRGMQVGDNQAGDLLDTLQEYPPQFAKLGIDGSQALGLISQGLKAGARDSDIVADAIKEFSIRAVDGSKLTATGFGTIGLSAQEMANRIGQGGQVANDALSLTLQRLRAIPDPVQRSQAAVALFGTQAEDLGSALFALDPTHAVQSLGQVAGSADRLGEALGDNPRARIDTFMRSLQQGAVNAGGAALKALTPVARPVDDMVTSLSHLPPTAQAAGIGMLGTIATAKGLAAAVPAVTSNVQKMWTSLREVKPSSLAAGGALAVFGITVGVLEQRLQAGKQKAADFVQTLLDTSGATGAAAQMKVLQAALADTGDASKLHGEQVFQTIVKYKELEQKVADETQAQKINTAAHTASASATDRVAASAGKAAGKISDERSELQKLNDTLDAGFNPREDMIKAQIALKESLAGLRVAYRDNGASLSDNTDKGRANQKALLDAIDAAKGMAQAQAGLGGTVAQNKAVLNTSIKQVRDAAAAAGLNKSQVDALIASINRVPPHKPSKIELEVAEAHRRAAAIQTRIDRMHGKNLQVNVTGFGIDRVQREINSITGKAVSIIVGSVHGPHVEARSKGGEVTGGIPGRDSVLSLLMPGERVLTVEQNRAYKRQLSAVPAAPGPGVAGGGDVHVHLHFAQPVGDPRALATTVEQALVKLKRSQGGVLAFQDS